MTLKEEERKQLVTMETTGWEDIWSNHGDKGKKWFLKVL